MADKFTAFRTRTQGINDRLLSLLPRMNQASLLVGTFNPRLGKALGVGVGMLAMASTAFKIQEPQTDAPPAPVLPEPQATTARMLQDDYLTDK